LLISSPNPDKGMD
jgi:hypothetical protein